MATSGWYFSEQVTTGSFDLEAFEMIIRSSMHRIGGSMLEILVNADGGGYQAKLLLTCQEAVDTFITLIQFSVSGFQLAYKFLIFYSFNVRMV